MPVFINTTTDRGKEQQLQLGQHVAGGEGFVGDGER